MQGSNLTIVRLRAAVGLPAPMGPESDVMTISEALLGAYNTVALTPHGTESARAISSFLSPLVAMLPLRIDVGMFVLSSTGAISIRQTTLTIPVGRIRLVGRRADATGPMYRRTGQVADSMVLIGRTAERRHMFDDPVSSALTMLKVKELYRCSPMRIRFVIGHQADVTRRAYVYTQMRRLLEQGFAIGINPPLTAFATSDHLSSYYGALAVPPARQVVDADTVFAWMQPGNSTLPEWLASNHASVSGRLGMMMMLTLTVSKLHDVGLTVGGFDGSDLGVLTEARPVVLAAASKSTVVRLYPTIDETITAVPVINDLMPPDTANNRTSFVAPEIFFDPTLYRQWLTQSGGFTESMRTGIDVFCLQMMLTQMLTGVHPTLRLEPDDECLSDTDYYAPYEFNFIPDEFRRKPGQLVATGEQGFFDRHYKWLQQMPTYIDQWRQNLHHFLVLACQYGLPTSDRSQAFGDFRAMFTDAIAKSRFAKAVGWLAIRSAADYQQTFAKAMEFNNKCQSDAKYADAANDVDGQAAALNIRMARQFALIKTARADMLPSCYITSPWDEHSRRNGTALTTYAYRLLSALRQYGADDGFGSGTYTVETRTMWQQAGAIILPMPAEIAATTTLAAASGSSSSSSSSSMYTH
jgi:hypothetical protein